MFNKTLPIIFLFSALHLEGQTLKLAVRGKESLVGATAQLVRLPDSLLFQGVSDEKGEIGFSAIPAGMYELRVQYIGHKEHYSTFRLDRNTSRKEVVLEEIALDLAEVTVVGKKPLIRQEDDKMIVDPEPLASSSMSTLEVLEKTPGLFVDQDGNIFLNGATPARVFINGREQRMSAQDMATILRSLPPSSILRIEVLKTPSARFDAASSGGIVNVVLRKGVRLGRNGSVNTALNQGRYGNRSAGFNFNFGGDKQAAYLNGNILRRDGLDELNSLRNMANGSSIWQTANTQTPGTQAFLGFGYNREFRQDWTLNADSRINLNGNQSKTDNETVIRSLENLVLSENLNHIDNQNTFFSLNQDFGLVCKRDSLGLEWDTKVSYTFSRNDAHQDYAASYTRPVPGLSEGFGDALTDRQFLLVQSDLTRNLPWAFKLETGFKTTFQTVGSRSDYFLRTLPRVLPDPLRTNHFSYSENINALYGQLSRSLPGNLRLKAGLRAESTLMEGRQKIPYDTSFLIRRLDFFPYLYLSRSIVKVAGFELAGFLIYRRTLNRPDYQNLNPAIRYIDAFLYETGNPALQPQFTENIEANISVDNMPLFALGRNYVRNIFSGVVYQDRDNARVLYRTFDNVGENRETYFRMILGIPPKGRYFFVVGSQYNWNEYDGVYENQPLAFRRGSWRFFTFQQLKLFKETKINISGFLLLRGQQGFYELGTFGQLNLSINQTLMKRKLTISLSGNDVFRTMVTRFNFNQGNVVTEGDRYSDNQRIGLNVRYAFGIPKKEKSGGFFPTDME